MMVTRRPGAPLSAAVACIWHSETAGAAHERHRVFPDGRFQLVIDLAAGAGGVSGLRSHHVVVDMAIAASTMGVVFRPGGARGFFDEPALDFYARSVALDLLWGCRANLLIERLREAASAETRLDILERALCEESVMPRRTGGAAADSAVRRALRSFQMVPHVKTVAAISRDIGWSRRWMTQMFAEHVGITPKRFCRLMRFQHVIRTASQGRRVDWSDVALSGGFADQAHLAHEFRAFSGLSPERYLSAERPFPNHARID